MEGGKENPIKIGSEDDGSEDEDVGQRCTKKPCLESEERCTKKPCLESEESGDDDGLFTLSKNFSDVQSPIKKEQVEQRPNIIELHGENVPFFSRQKKHLTTTGIVETLLDPELDRNLVSTIQPVGVESNAVFIVDLKFLKNTKDITCDELGSWKNNGCHDTWVIVDAHGIAETCGKAKPVAASDGSVPYRVCKKYYVNKGSPDFRRMIVFLEGAQKAFVRVL